MSHQSHDHQISTTIETSPVVDDELLLFGLKAILQSITGVLIVGETDNALEALKLAGKLKPDLVLMDLTLTSSDAVDATRQIKRLTPSIAVLAFTSVTASQSLLEDMTAGADGYFLKSSSSKNLVTAILTVLGGGSWIDPLVARELQRLCG